LKHKAFLSTGLGPFLADPAIKFDLDSRVQSQIEPDLQCPEEGEYRRSTRNHPINPDFRGRENNQLSDDCRGQR
jgi:hypothetical protein